MRVAMLALLVVMLFVLTVGRLTGNQLTDSTIRTAVSDWCAGGERRTQVENTFGPIADWNTNKVNDMRELFYNKETCNPDIGSWNTSAVTTWRTCSKIPTRSTSRSATGTRPRSPP
jgi:hypothetical protein